MNLYKHKNVPSCDDWFSQYPEATQADVTAYLAERGMVAVPVEPTELMVETGWPFARQSVYPADQVAKRIYKAMIKAAGEQ